VKSVAENSGLQSLHVQRGCRRQPHAFANSAWVTGKMAASVVPSCKADYGDGYWTDLIKLADCQADPDWLLFM